MVKGPRMGGREVAPDVQRARSRKPARAFVRTLLALLVLQGAVLFLPAVDADPSALPVAKLPSRATGTSAVWDGTSAYVFGGGHGGVYADTIVRFTPDTNTVTTMTATLPAPLTHASAVWDGTNAFIFGGMADGRSDRILRYTPANDTLTTMAATLPDGMDSMSAVWDGQYAYVFGGYVDGAPYSPLIVRYDPAQDSVRVMRGTLPSGRVLTSAVWDGEHAYVFGGYGTLGSTRERYLDEIVRYTPSTDTVTVMSSTLPTGRATTSAVWDGTYAYIFGGSTAPYPSLSNQIVRYEPRADTVTILSATISPARKSTSAVWGGGSAYVFGGWSGGETQQILRFYPGAAEVNDPVQASPRATPAWDGSASVRPSPSSPQVGSPTGPIPEAPARGEAGPAEQHEGGLFVGTIQWFLTPPGMGALLLTLLGGGLAYWGKSSRGT